MDEILNNLTLSVSQINFLLHVSDGFEGDREHVKPDSGPHYIMNRAQLFGFLSPSKFLINQAFTSFQLSDSVLRP